MTEPEPLEPEPLPPPVPPPWFEGDPGDYGTEESPWPPPPDDWA